MKLKSEKKSTNVVHATETPMPGKDNRQDRPAHIYQSRQFKEALNDISTQFRDATAGRTGKGERESVGQHKKAVKTSRDYRYQK